MQRLYEAADAMEAQLCRDYLAERGIEVHVYGGMLQGGVGELPADVRPTLWIADPRQYELARELIAEVLAPPPAQDPWRCRGCGETVDAELDLCWSCGRARPRGQAE